MMHQRWVVATMCASLLWQGGCGAGSGEKVGSTASKLVDDCTDDDSCCDDDTTDCNGGGGGGGGGGDPTPVCWVPSDPTNPLSPIVPAYSQSQCDNAGVTTVSAGCPPLNTPCVDDQGASGIADGQCGCLALGPTMSAALPSPNAIVVAAAAYMAQSSGSVNLVQALGFAINELTQGMNLSQGAINSLAVAAQAVWFALGGSATSPPPNI